MDTTAEFDPFEKRDLRSNRSRVDKPWNEEGFVTKVVIGHIRQPEILKAISSRLPDDRCGAEWNDDVHYSLKKKGRWSLLDDMCMKIEAWNDYYYDAQGDSSIGRPTIAAMEKRITWALHRTRRSSPKCLAYHGMEMDADQLVAVHRYPKHAFGNDSTMTQKPSGPKAKKSAKARRSTNDRRPLAPVTPEEPELIVNNEAMTRLQYVICTIQDQDQFRKLKAFRRSRGHHRRCAVDKFLLDDDWSDEDHEYGQLEESAADAIENELARSRVVQDAEDLDEQSIDSFGVDKESNDDRPGEPAANMSVDLADLASLQRLQAAARSQKRRKRHSRRQRHTDCETSVSFCQLDHLDNVAGPSGVINIASDSDGPAKIQPVSQKLLSDDYFQIIPTEVLCSTDAIREASLREAYGDAYYECACIPRRFVIDVSTTAKSLLQSIHGDHCANLDMSILCVCEIVPPMVPVALLDENEQSAAVPLRVWINGSFSRHVRGVCIDTINPCIPHTMDQIVECVVKMAGALPLECYRKLPTVYSVDNARRAAGQLLVSPSTRCVERSMATTEILGQENMLKKIQRQITAVAGYDWYCNVGESICSICLDFPVEEIGFCLSVCRHWFCTRCWRLYCTERILNGWGSLTCPHPKCNSVVDYYTLSTSVPLPICQTYTERLLDMCIGKYSKEWIWCPNAKCGRLINLAGGSPIPSLVCICGSFWCTKCSGASHWPASCEHAKSYIDMLKDRQDDPTLLDRMMVLGNKIRSVDVRRCPHCRILMEKGEGCICMTCRCGKNFCWACGRPWDNINHGSCYSTAVVQGLMNVRLIDVNQRSSEIREMFYEHSLAHRMATRYPNVSKLRHTLFTKCWDVPRRVQKLSMVIDESPKVTGQRTEQGLHQRVLAASAHAQRFLETQHQAHYLLEFIYVHLQYCNRRSWADVRALKWDVDRLEFALDRMEEACKVGDLRKVDEFMECVKSLLQSLMKKMTSAKFGATGGEDR